MRHLLALLALIWLSTGSATCCTAEAAEPLQQTMLADAEHIDGDKDHVPADSHGDYPHHHKSCGGHDISATVARLSAPGWIYAADQYGAARIVSVAEAPPGKNLRPPIA